MKSSPKRSTDDPEHHLVLTDADGRQKGFEMSSGRRTRKRAGGFESKVLPPLPAEWEVVDLIKILGGGAPELSERYSVKSLGVFGSYVHNKQRKGSDLDVLVEFFEVPSLLKFIELEHYLADLLGVKVDLVMKDALKPAIGRHILAEVVPV